MHLERRIINGICDDLGTSFSWILPISCCSMGGIDELEYGLVRISSFYRHCLKHHPSGKGV